MLVNELGQQKPTDMQLARIYYNDKHVWLRTSKTSATMYHIRPKSHFCFLNLLY